MPEILALLIELLGVASTIESLISTIQGMQQQAAEETSPYTIQTASQTAERTVDNAEWGNQAIRNLNESMRGDDTSSLSGIVALLNALSPVTLPPAQPPLWPGEVSENLLNQVVRVPWYGDYEWTNQLASWFHNAQVLSAATLFGEGVRERTAGWFALTDYGVDFWWASERPDAGLGNIVAPVGLDWTLWDGVQTLVEFLNAQLPYWEWSDVSWGGQVTYGMAWGWRSGMATARWRCMVPEAELPLMSGRLWAAVQGGGTARPPIWPGLAGVTLGTPVALDAGVHVDGPMDGALLNITATDRVMPFQTTGSLHTYRNTGRFQFLNDDGWAEDWVGIPSNHAQLMPRQMAHAGGLDLAFYCGVTGTVTPFTIDSA